MEFYENLKNLRKSGGFTQVQLAKLLGLSERQYQYLEAGKSKPTYDTLLKIADYFKVTLDDLVGRVPPKA